MIKTLFQCLLAAAVGLFAWWWFGAVMPRGVAVVFAVAVAVVSIYSIIAGQLKYSLLLFGGPVLMSWPLGAHLARGAAHLVGQPIAWETALGMSWIAPVAAWKLHYSVAEKRDQARDFGGWICGGVLLYVCTVTLYSANPAAAAFASLGVAGVASTAQQQAMIPPELETGLRWLAIGGVLLAAIYASRAVIF